MAKFAIGDRVDKASMTMKAAWWLAYSPQTMASLDTLSIWKATVRYSFY